MTAASVTRPAPVERAPDTVILGDDTPFRQSFNRRAFAFDHTLASHPLFTVPRLVALAEKILTEGDPHNFVVSNARVGTIDKFADDLPIEQRVAETVRRMDDAGAWLKLTRVNEIDPAYQDLLQRYVRDLERLTGLPLMNDITWATVTVFMASPGIYTPYHIDHESNCLFQIQGDKDVCLFNGEDRTIVPDEEIERFYLKALTSAKYKQELQDQGTVFRLTPGKAVHHPPLAPHWVRNGDAVSISAAMSFSLRPLETRARIYQANAFLRRMGLRPTPPGQSRVADGMKSAVLKAFSNRRPKNWDELLFSGVDRIKAVGGRIRRRKTPSAPAARS
jgi:hypothetical protein